MGVKSVDRYIPLLDRGRYALFSYMDFSVGMMVKRQQYEPGMIVPVAELTELSKVLSIAVSRKRSLKS